MSRSHPRDDVWALAAEMLERGERICLATVVRAASAAAPAGTKALFTEDGLVAGHGRFPDDGGLVRSAADALARRRTGLVEAGDGSQVFLDVMGSQPRLVVCGAGHVAVPLVRLARDAGFEVTVVDDRPEFAHPARFPGAAVVAEDFVPTLAALDLGPDHYVVIITRGHEHDAECLAEVLRKPVRYVGMIGSRRRVAFVLTMLEREGVARDRLERVFSPIGLPIGAESPDEIALSIAAELVCVRRRGPAQAVALRAAALPGGEVRP